MRTGDERVAVHAWGESAGTPGQSLAFSRRGGGGREERGARRVGGDAVPSQASRCHLPHCSPFPSGVPGVPGGGTSSSTPERFMGVLAFLWRLSMYFLNDWFME